MAAEWIEPREDCPRCGAALLIERFENTPRPHAPVRYCSFVTCDWSDHPELSPTCCIADPEGSPDLERFKQFPEVP